MALPQIHSVLYFDPWTPSPPMAEQALGLTAKVEPAGAPPSSVLAALMQRNGEAWGSTQVSSSATSVNLFPPGPLSPSVAYEVLVKWVPEGTPPAQVSWAAATFSAAPVVSAGMRILAGEYDGSNLILAWEGGLGPGALPGAYVQVIDEGGVVRGTLGTSGDAGTVPLASKQAGYGVYIRGMTPLAPSTQGSFKAPFSWGSPAPPLPLPGTGPEITKVECDEDGFAVAWTPVATPTSTPDAEYTLHLLVGGKEVATYPALATGTHLPLAELPASGSVSLAGRARFGPLRGPLGKAIEVPAAGPTVAKARAQLDSSSGNPEVVVEPGPCGSLEPLVDLVVDGVVTVSKPATGTPPAATLPLKSVEGPLVEVRCRAKLGSFASTGPPGPATPVFAVKSQIGSAGYDGERLRIVLAGEVPAGVTSYAIVVASGASKTTLAAAPAPVLEVAAELDLAAAWNVAVEPRGNRTTGIASDAAHVALPAVVAPVLKSLAYDGATLALEWDRASLPGLVGYTVQFTDSAKTTYQTGLETGLTVPLLPASVVAGVAVQVTGVSATRSTAASTQLRLPLATPAVTAASANRSSGAVTVDWAAPDGPAPAGYLVQPYLDGQPLGAAQPATGSPHVLAAPPPSEGEATVAVAARWEEKGAVVLGPFGPALALANRPPTLREVGSDGLTASARWDPVPGASGYALTVLDKSGQAVGSAQAGAAEDRARFPVQLKAGAGPFTLAIQPRAGVSTGPASQLPLFSPGFYLTTSLGPPVLLRAPGPPIEPLPVTAYLADVGTLRELPIAPAQGTKKPPFTLAANTESTTSAAFPYTLTIANGALEFEANATVRSEISTLYAKLLEEAETKGASARGVLTIQETIARLMPQTLPETLFYAYGLSAAGTVDLRPGTILRVAFSEHDATASPEPKDWSSGYAGGAVVDYEVGDYLNSHGEWAVGFDAFVSRLIGIGVLTVQAPQPTPPTTALAADDFAESGAAEAADLYYPAFQKPFHRLFVPQELQEATPPAVGRTGRQFAIAAAASWTEIEAAGPTPSGTVAVAYFRGRTVVKLCLRVTVDGSERVVPVGTTVGNLLDQSADRSPRAPIPLLGLTLERSLGPAVLEPASPAPFAAGRRERVRLDWQGMARWAGGDALSLPVLPGDRIELGES